MPQLDKTHTTATGASPAAEETPSMAWTQGISCGGPKATNFAVTCNLLSEYIKEKGGVSDLGLAAASQPGICGKGKSAVLKPPRATTMNLLPLISAEDSAKNPNIREPEKAQLTIFYGGKVLVFDDFPAEKAKDLMNFAGKGTENLQNFGYVAPSSGTAMIAECQNDSANGDFKIVSASVNTSAGAQGQPQVSAQEKISILPIARKASLHRFLERRKDRINARAPYQATDSSAKPTPKIEESKSWLGLSPQVSEHAHSRNSDCSR